MKEIKHPEIFQAINSGSEPVDVDLEEYLNFLKWLQTDYVPPATYHMDNVNGLRMSGEAFVMMLYHSDYFRSVCMTRSDSVKFNAMINNAMAALRTKLVRMPSTVMVFDMIRNSPRDKFQEREDMGRPDPFEVDEDEDPDHDGENTHDV